MRSPTSRQPKEWDINAVGSDEYLASLTRRLDVLEKKLVGENGGVGRHRPLFPAIQVSVVISVLCLIS